GQRGESADRQAAAADIDVARACIRQARERVEVHARACGVNHAAVFEAVKGIDYVLHQAALPSVLRSVENPLSSNAINIDGTLNLLEASRKSGVKKFVMASSSAIYGESEELPQHEDMTPSPLSPYAVTKLTNDYYLRVYRELYRFPTVALRYFNVFGPYQDPQSDYAAVIPKFITGLLKGEVPLVFGDGEQSRDFIYVDNCVEANILAATNDKMTGEQYNVASGRRYTLNQILEILKKIIGTDIKVKYTAKRKGDILHSYGSIDKLKKYGYQPTVDFEEGLRHTVEYYKNRMGYEPAHSISL
ncbi:MAG: NAD-dependent epimerase/dehydratase family protein, partial [Candidatus Zixiibacteriota bacterium]